MNQNQRRKLQFTVRQRRPNGHFSESRSSKISPAVNWGSCDLPYTNYDLTSGKFRRYTATCVGSTKRNGSFPQETSTPKTSPAPKTQTVIYLKAATTPTATFRKFAPRQLMANLP